MVEERSEHVGLTTLHFDRMGKARFEHVGLTTLHVTYFLPYLLRAAGELTLVHARRFTTLLAHVRPKQYRDAAYFLCP